MKDCMLTTRFIMIRRSVKMKEGRHRIILQELDRSGLVSVRKLKDLLDVTDMTIRRDLIDLEKQGFLIRVHGGAHKKIRDGLIEVSHAEKAMLNTEEKQVIAKKCADLISAGDTIFIGSGTTTALIGDYLEDKKVNIVTNSLPIFDKLKDNPHFDLLLIGGRYRVKTHILFHLGLLFGITPNFKFIKLPDQHNGFF